MTKKTITGRITRIEPVLQELPRARTLEARREEMRAQMRQRDAEKEEARRQGTYWSVYGAASHDAHSGRTKVTLALRNTDWTEDQTRAFDNSHAGASMTVGPTVLLGRREDAFAKACGLLCADEITVRVL